MYASHHSHIMLNERAEAVECAVFDPHRLTIDHREFAGAIQAILDGQVAELGRDRNAICYRVSLAERNEASCTAIVKVPRPGPQRTNADTTFAWEAEILAALPVTGIIGTPALLGRVAVAGRHFLFTTEVPGKHPDPRTNPLDGRQLRAILDPLYEMDCHGFMHYDLKASNTMVDGDRAGFIDFEFARFEDLRSAYALENAAFCEDFNVSVNPFFPARSNVANFEFRALHRYLRDLAATQSVAAAGALFREWLRSKSSYHRRMAGFLAELAETSLEHIAIASGIMTDEARGKLCAAAAYESLLAALLEQPHDAVARVERSLMAFRCAVFERRAAEAQRLRSATLAQICPDAAHADTIPGAYRLAIARALELVGRSVHPSA